MANDRQRLVEQADAAARRGDLAGAAAIYRQVIALAPDDVVVLQRLADALARVNQSEDARAVFRELAGAYRRQGHQTRAIAALRRAVRIDNPPAELIEELAILCLESGLAADAREPVLAAGRAYEERRDFAAARTLYETALRMAPAETVFGEALARLAETIGDATERARARARLAMTRAAAGDADRVIREVAACLLADPTTEISLPALEAGIFELAALGPEVFPAELPELVEVRDRATWAVFRTRLLAAARVSPAEPLAAVARAARTGELVGVAALWAATLLLRQGDDEGADRAARTAVRDLGARDRFLQPLADLLNALVGRDPGRQWAVDCLERLTDTGRRLSNAGRRVDIAVSDNRDDDSPPLPDAIRARIFEAEALVQHGLTDTATRVLQGIPVAHREHPLVVRVMEQAGMSVSLGARAVPVDNVLALPPEPVAEPNPREPRGTWTRPNVIEKSGAKAPEAPAAAPAEPRKAAPGDRREAEDLDFVLEDMTGEVSGEAESPVDELIAEPADLALLGEKIGLLVPDSDPETSYQMAIGFVEMGLADQARPLLEHVLRDPTRAIDATLLLMRLEVEAGDDRAAFAIGATQLRSDVGRAPTTRAELAATLAPIAKRLGRPDVALQLVHEVERLAPAHRELSALRKLAGVPKS